MDEGGGYYDSGYIQPTSFFGDGTRVPMIAVSPFVRPGRRSHLHRPCLGAEVHRGELGPPAASSSVSLDNLPNPIAGGSDPYVPTNGPAIGNLMSLFDFHRSSAQIAAARTSLLRMTAAHTMRPFERATVTAPDSHDLD